jgi:hypothetical protein
MGVYVSPGDAEAAAVAADAHERTRMPDDEAEPLWDGDEGSCPGCGTALPPASESCAECGLEFPSVVACARCGGAVEASAAACAVCGAPL